MTLNPRSIDGDATLGVATSTGLLRDIKLQISLNVIVTALSLYESLFRIPVSVYHASSCGNIDSFIRHMSIIFICHGRLLLHYDDVIMGSMASPITSLTIVYSTVYSGADQGKHQSPASLDFVRVIYQVPENSVHKWPVTPKMFPFDDVIMRLSYRQILVCVIHGYIFAPPSLVEQSWAVDMKLCTT